MGCEFWTGGTARCVHLAPSEVVEIPVTESFAAVSKTFPGRSPDFGHLGYLRSIASHEPHCAAVCIVLTFSDHDMIKCRMSQKNLVLIQRS